MDEIKIGAEIVFNITGNHNIGYAKGEKYIGTVLSRDLRHNVMCLLHGRGFEIRHIDSYSWWMTNERLMSEVTYAEGDIHIVVHECMEDYVDNVRFEEEFYKNKEV